MRLVRTTPALGKAGGYADRHFDELYRPWLRKVRLVYPLAILPLFVLVGGLALIYPGWLGFYTGAAFGAALALYVSLTDNPPEPIAKWRRGGEGERNTARRLRRLQRRGWTVVHDLDDAGRGNLDHVVVGPSGVFLLETKNLHGALTVEGDALVASYGNEHHDRFVNEKCAKRARAKAADLKSRLAQSGVRWVTPIVVLWGEFPARSVLENRVMWIHGDELAGWLEAQPRVLPESTQSAVRAYLEDRLAAESPGG